LKPKEKNHYQTTISIKYFVIIIIITTISVKYISEQGN